MLTTVLCKKCNKGIVAHASHKRIFCSKSCKSIYQKTGHFKKGEPSWNKGLKVSGMSGKKQSEYQKIIMSGENNHNWNGGKSREKHTLGEPRYKKWRTSILVRDNFKCRIGGEQCNGCLEVHHILRWADYIELRYKINNGITLCHAHHPRKRAEEKRLVSTFMELVSASS